MDLWIALDCGDLDEIKYLLKNNPEINLKSEICPDEYYSFFHAACLLGQLDIVKYCIEIQNIPVNYQLKGQVRKTPLHYAVLGGHSHVINYLMTAKASVDAQDEFGETPLHIAIQTSRLDIIQLLLESWHANVNIVTYNDINALYIAGKYYNSNIIKYLVRSGADLLKFQIENYLQDRVQEERHILIVAICKGDADLVQFLCDAGASMDPYNYYASIKQSHSNFFIGINSGQEIVLHTAVLSSLEVVKVVVRAGAILNAEYTVPSTNVFVRKMSILHIAIENGKDSIVRYFIEELGMNCNMPTSTCRWTPLHFAVSFNSLDLASYLVKVGANLEVRTKRSGFTPLMLAVAIQCPVDMIEFLCKAGADVNTRDSRANRTPLVLLVQQAHLSLNMVETVKCLIKAGADLNSECNANGDAITTGTNHYRF